ncbi:translation initiation factor IF-2-like isoform X2 [Cervus elaphus]|uniref:translation initiation factor IF-2-like isoform X2 n=1 Tax=Cervus elaphus TaxID=9860 RepID=UPI001CC2F586|nr:translation initiation factor IF-2-like isoform X2 [Cervus elaphus]XP_043779289.1 translation initiation factor IF-2-like isoform X2 [Cervus elaphus]XP_043779290.1 translation initiation factor IF-2-like isoform X2 [Cervus elaphus]
MKLEPARSACGDPAPCEPTAAFWAGPRRPAGLRQRPLAAGLQCRRRPLGGAGRRAERGKRGRAGGPGSLTPGQPRPPPGPNAEPLRSSRLPRGARGAARRSCGPWRGGGGRWRGTANDRAEGRLAQPIPEPLQHRFPTHCGAGTEGRGRPAPRLPCPGAPARSPGRRAAGQRLPGPGCCRPSLLPGVGRGTRSQLEGRRLARGGGSRRPRIAKKTEAKHTQSCF